VQIGWNNLLAPLGVPDSMEEDHWAGGSYFESPSHSESHARRQACLSGQERCHFTFHLVAQPICTGPQMRRWQCPEKRPLQRCAGGVRWLRDEAKRDVQPLVTILSGLSWTTSPQPPSLVPITMEWKAHGDDGGAGAGAAGDAEVTHASCEGQSLLSCPDRLHPHGQSRSLMQIN
jgi:hypothetical protein